MHVLYSTATLYKRGPIITDHHHRPGSGLFVADSLITHSRAATAAAVLQPARASRGIMLVVETVPTTV